MPSISHYPSFLTDEGVTASPDLGDMSPEGPQPPLILLQQLLAAATQPSPVKAIFDKQELEVGSASVSGQCAPVLRPPVWVSP